MSDAEVIAAIRQNHLKANIAEFEENPAVTVHWERARIDRGGTIFGAGPYLKVPVSGDGWDGTVHRVYPPAQLRLQLAKKWAPTGDRQP